MYHIGYYMLSRDQKSLILSLENVFFSSIMAPYVSTSNSPCSCMLNKKPLILWLTQTKVFHFLYPRDLAVTALTFKFHSIQLLTFREDRKVSLCTPVLAQDSCRSFASRRLSEFMSTLKNFSLKERKAEINLKFNNFPGIAILWEFNLL